MASMRRSPDWYPTAQWGPNPRLSDWPEEWSRMLDEGRLKIEEYREDGNLVIRAEVPGIDPDSDVEITVADGMLNIRAERREERKTEGEEGYRSEFRYGSFSRSIRLPTGVSEEEISASYKEGILEVRAPIDGDTETPRKIPVSFG